MRKWNLVIYIPVFNASASLPELFSRFENITKQLDKLDAKIVSIIVVNDGSTDHTVEVLSSLEKQFSFLSITNKRTNEGPAAAVIDGAEKALEYAKNPEKTIIIRMDSDLEHQPEDIGRLILPIISSKTTISVGYIPFDSRNGHFAVWFNQQIGLKESRDFLELDIPHFCPGFIAIRADFFKRIFPSLLEKARKFKKLYQVDLLTMDFVTLTLAKQLRQEPAVIKLTPIEDKWIKKMPIIKILSYIRYHMKTTAFLKNELRI